MEILYGNKSITFTDGDSKIMSPYIYIQRLPRTHVSTKLTTALNHWLQIPLETLEAIGETVQSLQAPCLLIDDIQDSSTLRGGAPVAHAIYGIPLTINACFQATAIAIQKAIALGHPMAATVMVEQIIIMCRGQGLEVYWRDNFQCPTEEEFKQSSIEKVGGMYKLVLRLMQLFSQNQTQYGGLVDLLGYYVEVKDSFLALWTQEYTGKNYCDDVSEGKFTVPITHAVKAEKEDNQVYSILRQRTKDVKTLRYCVTVMEGLGSFHYTKDLLQRLDSELRTEIARLGGNPHLDAILNEFCQQIEAAKPLGSTDRLKEQKLNGDVSL